MTHKNCKILNKILWVNFEQIDFLILIETDYVANLKIIRK